jgi:hypothetical protein
MPANKKNPSLTVNAALPALQHSLTLLREQQLRRIRRDNADLRRQIFPRPQPSHARP